MPIYYFSLEKKGVDINKLNTESLRYFGKVREILKKMGPPTGGMDGILRKPPMGRSWDGQHLRVKVTKWVTTKVLHLLNEVIALVGFLFQLFDSNKT